MLRPCVLYLAFGEVGVGTGRVRRRPICDVALGVIGRTPLGVTLFTGPGFGLIRTALLLRTGSSFLLGSLAFWALAPADQMATKQLRSAALFALFRMVGSLAVCRLHLIGIAAVQDARRLVCLIRAASIAIPSFCNSFVVE